MAITFDEGIIGRRNFGIVISIMDAFDISNKQKNIFSMSESFSIISLSFFIIVIFNFCLNFIYIGVNLFIISMYANFFIAFTGKHLHDYWSFIQWYKEWKS